MQYRKLSKELVSCLESASMELTWPPYRAFKRYSVRNGFAFAEREYSRLRRLHVGPAELVESLITYLGKFHETSTCSAIPQLVGVPHDQWRDRLSGLLDGRRLRHNDYYRGVTWRELPLLMMLGDGIDGDRSYCRNEAMARCIADAQYQEIAKSLSSPSDWRRLGINNPIVRQRLGESLDEFVSYVVRLWTSVPESVWLVHSRNALVGGSVVAPVCASAYEQLRSGQLNDIHLAAERDWKFPSRDFFVIAMTELPNRPRSRLPGVKTAIQTRKFLQHCAVLLGENQPSTEPVRFLVAVGSKKDEKAVERLGFQPLHRIMTGSDCPLYEMVIPAPESTYAQYSSAELTIATLIGIIWRNFRRDDQRFAPKNLIKSASAQSK